MQEIRDRRRNCGHRRFGEPTWKSACAACPAAPAAKYLAPSGEISDFVSEALERITSRVRETASEAGQTIAEEAKSLGSGAVKKLTDEVEHRPLLMLAAAAGIGFLAGLANRR